MNTVIKLRHLDTLHGPCSWPPAAAARGVPGIWAPPTVTTYDVTVTGGTGGSVSPSSAVVSAGGTATFTVNSVSGYVISSVTGCDGSLSGNTYTTGAISAACASGNTYRVACRPLRRTELAWRASRAPASPAADRLGRKHDHPEVCSLARRALAWAFAPGDRLIPRSIRIQPQR